VPLNALLLDLATRIEAHGLPVHVSAGKGAGLGLEVKLSREATCCATIHVSVLPVPVGKMINKSEPPMAVKVTVSTLNSLRRLLGNPQATFRSEEQAMATALMMEQAIGGFNSGRQI
jgi:hypothetical protein